MSETTYLALLRGINVGGNNIIKMAALKACFEGMGLKEVSTYIQSGNVIFSSEEANLTPKIEKVLSETFNYASKIVLIDAAIYKKILTEVPKGFGQDPEHYRYDVLFLKEPLIAAEALPQIPKREGVDEVHAGSHAIYFSRLISQITKSQINRLIQVPALYKNITIRNWNTTKKLGDLMETGQKQKKPVE